MKIQQILDYLRQQDVAFWVKHSATALTLVHVYLTAHDFSPWYKFSGLTVALLWCWLSKLWKEPSIMALNLFLAVAGNQEFDEFSLVTDMIIGKISAITRPHSTAIS